MGILSPVGNTLETAWNALLQGRSCISLIGPDRFDTEAFSTKIAGMVDHFDPTVALDPKEVRRLDTFVQYGVVAAQQAVQDSGLEITDELAPRAGASVGS